VRPRPAGPYLVPAPAGRLRAALPVTAIADTDAVAAAATGWDAAAPNSLPKDRAIGFALALARALRRLATATTWRPLASPSTAAAALTPLGGGGGGGGGDIDGGAFAAWKAAWQAEAARRPALLAAFGAAGRWGNLAAAPGLAEAGLRPASSPPRRSRPWREGGCAPSPCPIWAAVPARPAQRWRDRPGFDAAGGRLDTGCDRRSRLPEAVDAALRTPVLTPGALAWQLKVVPQTATDLLGRLAAAGMVRKAMGRRSFRTFGVAARERAGRSECVSAGRVNPCGRPSHEPGRGIAASGG
jgi:hypothetical protein